VAEAVLLEAILVRLANRSFRVTRMGVVRENPFAVEIIGDSRTCYDRPVIRFLLSVLVWFLRAVLRSRGAVVLENLALRQQLATYSRGHKRPQVKPEERLFWAVLWKVWPGWRSAWLMVKPATVLNHFIFLSAEHVLRVCREYSEYYHRARPSQALHAIPDPYPELTKPPLDQGQLLALPVLGGRIHDDRRAA
jgi:hypothetical protein